MYYSELDKSPISEFNVKRLYGIDPVNDLVTAKRIGIYTLNQVPAGYAVSYYRKNEDDTYTAVPHCVTIQEQQMVAITRKLETTLGSFRTLFGLPATQEVPQAINGYYPLYTSEAESDYASDNGESHEHVIDGVTYYMPDSGVPLFHGNYDTYGTEPVIDDSDDSGDSSY